MMKKKRRMRFLVMMVMMLALLVPAGAMANYGDKNLDVLGVNVNTGAVSYWKVVEKGGYSTLDPATDGDYNVKYHRADQTLTLRNVNATKAAAINVNSLPFIQTYLFYSNGLETIHIVLEGENTFKTETGTLRYGIRAGNYVDLEIGGTGSLLIDNVVQGIYVGGSDYSTADVLRISGGDIEIHSKESALVCYNGKIDITGGTLDLYVNANGHTGALAGVSAHETINIQNAELSIDMNVLSNGSGVNAFKSYGGSQTGIILTNSNVLAKINTTTDHVAVFGMKPVVTGGNAYISTEYNPNEKQIVEWDKNSEIGYDNLTYQPYNSPGKGNKYFSQTSRYRIEVGVNPENYGTATGAGTFAKDAEATVTASANSGYKFVNWTENGAVVSTSPEYKFTVKQNRNLIANFAPVYTVTYTDGVEGEEIFPDEVNTGLLADDNTPAFTGDLTREGYGFAGWKSSVTDTVSTTVPEKVTGDVTYTAQWEKLPTYTVTYTDGVDGETVFENKVFAGLYEGDDTPAFNGEPKRAGYIFAGWSPAVAQKVAGNATYTAQWTADPTQLPGDSTLPPDLPQTGDHSRMGLWFAMIGMAGAVLVLLRRRAYHH